MNLDELRAEIDLVNREMTNLFKQRMELSAKIGKCKQEKQLPVYDKERERQILSQMSALAGEELEVYTRILFATLFDLSRAYQTNVTAKSTRLTNSIHTAMGKNLQLFPAKAVVACQGAEGSYSQIATDKLFSRADIMYFKNFEGVFQAIENGLCEYGVLPIENSSYGSVNEVYDLMRHHDFSIVRSMKLHIDHNLLAKPGVALENIQEIFSHQQAIGQCSKFLSAHPHIKVTACENTAIAAKMVAESNRTDVAAISSHNCAALYGLAVLEEHMQNSENNYTRFICVAKDLEIYTGANRISLMFSVSHQPGSLYSMVSKFSVLGLNLTKLESRPIPGRDFEFLFYFDLEASVWSESVMHLLSELSSTGELFVFLGAYSEIS